MAHKDCETEWFDTISIAVGDLCQVSNSGYPIAGYYQVMRIEAVVDLQTKPPVKPRKWRILFRKIFTSGMQPINGKVHEKWAQWIPVSVGELELKIAAKQVRLSKALDHLYKIRGV